MTGPGEASGHSEEQYGGQYGGQQYGGGYGQYGGQQGGGQYGQQYGGGEQYGGYQAYPAGGQQYGGYQQYPGGYNQMQGPGSPAGVGIRFGARVIDTLIILIPQFIVQIIVAASLGSVDSVGGFTLDTFGVGYWVTSAIVSIVFAAIWVVYFVYLETTKGQTLGKQLLHLRVLGAAGGNPTRDESLKRNGYIVLLSAGMVVAAVIPFVGPIIDWLCSIAALIFVIVIAVTINSSPTKQGKHDEMAGGTRVVTTQ